MPQDIFDRLESGSASSGDIFDRVSTPKPGLSPEEIKRRQAAAAREQAKSGPARPQGYTSADFMSAPMRALSTAAEMLDPRPIVSGLAEIPATMARETLAGTQAAFANDRNAAVQHGISAISAPATAAAKMVAGIPSAVVGQLGQAAGEIQSGDVASGLTRGALTIAPFGKGIVKGAKAAPSTAVSVAQKSKAMVTGVPMRPNVAIQKALKPKSTNIKFMSDLDRALPEIKITEQELGRPINGLDDLIEAIPLAKQRVRAQYDQIAGPQRMREISGASIADAIERSIPAKMRLQDTRGASRIMDKADTYRREFTIEQLEDFQKTTNAELDAYYGKYPAAQRTAKTGNPEVAHMVAEVEAIRKAIYDTLDGPGQGAAPRELNRRYGALMNLERETQRRLNVAQRQQPDSLTQQMGKLHAGFEIGKGLTRMVTGDIAGGASNLASAYAGRKMADFIKERNTADAMIRSALANEKRRPVPVQMPPIPPRSRLIAPEE